jgi:hypothetical protein
MNKSPDRRWSGSQLSRRPVSPINRTWYAERAFLIPPAVLRAAWLIKAFGRSSLAGLEIPMLSSFTLAVTICLVVGIGLVMLLGMRARTDDNIARVLYDVEHPEKTR